MFYYLLLIIILSFFEFIGDSNFKSYARSNKNSCLVFGMIAYLIMIFCLVTALKHGNLMFTNSMWDGISAILSTLGAYFLFHERLNNKLQWVGLGLIFVGCILLGQGKILK